MITVNLTDSEKAIALQIIKTVFGETYQPSEVLGLHIQDETVEIMTIGGLCSLGKAYFRQLVAQIKAQLTGEENERGTGRVKQAQAVSLLSTVNNTSIWQVIGATGSRYEVRTFRNGYARCNCRAAKFGRKCYHIAAVAS